MAILPQTIISTILLYYFFLILEEKILFYFQNELERIEAKFREYS